MPLSISKSILLIIILAFLSPLLSLGEKLSEGMENLSLQEQSDSLLSLSEYYSYDNPDTAVYFAELAIELQKEHQNGPSATAYKLLADAWYYLNDFESAIRFYQQSAEIEKKNEGAFSEYYAQRINDVGYCYYVLGISDMAIKNYELALVIFDKIGNEEDIYSTLNNMGSVYFNAGEYEKAIEYFMQCLKYDEKHGNDDNLSITHNNIGKVYQAWKKYDLAINYYTHALEHARLTNNSNSEAIRLSNLGMSYYGKGDFKKAMELLLQAKNLDEKAGREFKVAIRKNELSKILAAQGDFDQAIAYAEEALIFFNKANVHKSRAYVYIDLGHYYKGMHNYLKSEQSYLTSMAIAEELKSDYLLMLSFKGYSELLEKWNKPEEALEYYKKYEAVNKRIFNAEKHKQLANFEIKFLTREIEIENELLKRENEEKKNRLILLSVGIISLSLISILIILFIRLKNKNLRQQKELAEHELKENDIEKRHLEDKVFAEQHINRLQQEQYTQNIEHKNQVLANSTLGLIRKNEFLIDLKSKIAESEKENGMSKKDIIRLINQNVDLNQDWNKFSIEFSEIHPGFFDKLKNDYPDLSESFIQLCAYLRINLLSKEIAQLQHISISAVNKNRQRLRKKLNLEAEADLSDFLKKLV